MLRERQQWGCELDRIAFELLWWQWSSFMLHGRTVLAKLMPPSLPSSSPFPFIRCLWSTLNEATVIQAQGRLRLSSPNCNSFQLNWPFYYTALTWNGSLLERIFHDWSGSYGSQLWRSNLFRAQLGFCSYREKPNKMQQCIKIVLFPVLNEAQHVSGDTPPVIRNLKLHKQPLVLHTWKAVGRAVFGRCQVASAT